MQQTGRRYFFEFQKNVILGDFRKCELANILVSLDFLYILKTKKKCQKISSTRSLDILDIYTPATESRYDKNCRRYSGTMNS